jgi:hypothetical protein
MKKLVLVVLALGISLTVFGQNEKLFFKSLSKQRTVHPTVREASMGISNNFTIRDSLLYFTQSFEKAVLSGRSAGAIKPTTIRAAQKKFPGKSYRAVSSRLKLYADEGKSTKLRYR